MFKKDLKKIIEKRDSPIVIINLQFYPGNKENTENTNKFEHSFSVSEFENKYLSNIPDFRSRAQSMLKKRIQSKSFQNFM